MPPTHWVICKNCGRKFDVGKKGGYYDGSRYVCKSCGKLVKKQVKEREDDTNPKNNDTWFKRNWKILFGIIFLIGGLGNIGQDWRAAIFGTIIGAGLTYFHFYPQIKARNQEKEQIETELRVRAEEIKKCKTCGARTKGTYCEFCGTKLE